MMGDESSELTELRENVRGRRAVVEGIVEDEANAQAELEREQFARDAAHKAALDAMAPTDAELEAVSKVLEGAKAMYVADPTDKSAKAIDDAKRALGLVHLRHDAADAKCKAAQDAADAKLEAARSRLEDLRRQRSEAESVIAMIEGQIAASVDAERRSRAGFHKRTAIAQRVFAQSFADMLGAWNQLLDEHRDSSARVGKQHLVLPILLELAKQGIVVNVEEMMGALLTPTTNPEASLLAVLAMLFKWKRIGGGGAGRSHLEAHKVKLERLLAHDSFEDADKAELVELANADDDPLGQKVRALHTLGRHVEARQAAATPRARPTYPNLNKVRHYNPVSGDYEDPDAPPKPREVQANTIDPAFSREVDEMRAALAATAERSMHDPPEREG